MNTEAKQLNRVEAAFAALYFAKKAEPTYETDAKGRKVRVFPKEAPITKEECRDFLIEAKRAVEEEEALEAVGTPVLKYWITAGYLVADGVSKGRFLISRKAAEAYKLPRPRLHGVLADFLV